MTFHLRSNTHSMSGKRRPIFNQVLSNKVCFRTGNCSMREIPASISMQLSADSSTVMGGRRQRRTTPRDENTILINTKEQENAVLGSLRHVRLRHARELLSVDPKKFVYSGTVSKKTSTLLKVKDFSPLFRETSEEFHVMFGWLNLSLKATKTSIQPLSCISRDLTTISWLKKSIVCRLCLWECALILHLPKMPVISKAKLPAIITNLIPAVLCGNFSTSQLVLRR